jgi:hypothetical protein
MSIIEHETLDLSERLYSEILDQISDLIGALSQKTQESKLSEKQDAAREALQGIEQDLRKSISDLRQNAEWKIFTLAFYGETNAGKSTLIECLRILLKEGTKVRQREEFHALQHQLGLGESNLKELEQHIEALSNRQIKLEGDLLAITQQYDQQAVELDRQAASLQQRIDAQKRAAGWIQRILHLFRKWPDESELQQVNASTLQLPKQRVSTIESIYQQQAEAQQSLDAAGHRRETALSSLYQLAVFEDGRIIGDGRSDFTRETQNYTFKIGEQVFQILDVPGIEGNEVKVSEQIGRAVKCAHAVFYVTGKAAPPQTGEAGRPGTLEKIKAHLGAQTEVWTLFNKRITNPRALHKPDLVSDDEQASLNDLDEMMRAQLGEHYQRTLTLSALPAFLAIADCLVPRSASAASREKFLSVLTPDELLDRSGIKRFYLHLAQNLIKDYKTKIRRSNLNKVGVVINDVCAEVDRMNDEEFRPLSAALQTQADNAGKQLRTAMKALESRLKNRGEQAVGEFESKVRNEIYGRIASNISNGDFEIGLQEIMTSEQQKLQAELPQQLDKEVTLFQKQVASIVDRFEKHANDLLASYAALRQTRLASDFTLNVTIDSGINLYGLLAGLVGGVLMIWNPAGWILMTISIATMVTGLLKSVRGVFNDDYKKGQQRKAAEANLAKACDQIRVSFDKSLNEALPTLEQKTDEICGMLQIPVHQAQLITEKLDSAQLQLKRLSNTLYTPGTY